MMKRWLFRIAVALITVLILSRMNKHYTEVPMRR